MKTYKNVNCDNQAWLSNHSFDKAWANYRDRMLELLDLMNMKIPEFKLTYAALKILRKETKKPNMNQYELHGMTTSNEAECELLEKKIEGIEEQTRIRAAAKKEYWGYQQKYKDEELKKHPRKYKTKYVEQM